jgi:hypothetical protein
VPEDDFAERALSLAEELMDPYNPSFLWGAKKQFDAMQEVARRFNLRKDVLPMKYIYAVISAARHKGLARGIRAWLSEMVGRVVLSSAAKNDYHIARWAMSGDDADIRVLCDRALKFRKAALPNVRSSLGSATAAWAVATIGGEEAHSVPFRAAVTRLYPQDHALLLTPFTLKD